jgi:hypothetical protein
MGLCVQCGKEKPFAGYVHCAECIEKVEEASRKCWADPEKRIRYNKHGNERKKNLYGKGKKMDYAQSVEDRLKVGRISIVNSAGKRKTLRGEPKIAEDLEITSKKG